MTTKTTELDVLTPTGPERRVTATPFKDQFGEGWRIRDGGQKYSLYARDKFTPQGVLAVVEAGLLPKAR